MKSTHHSQIPVLPLATLRDALKAAGSLRPEFGLVVDQPSLLFSIFPLGEGEGTVKLAATIRPAYISCSKDRESLHAFEDAASVEIYYLESDAVEKRRGAAERLGRMRWLPAREQLALAATNDLDLTVRRLAGEAIRRIDSDKIGAEDLVGIEIAIQQRSKRFTASTDETGLAIFEGIDESVSVTAYLRVTPNFHIREAIELPPHIGGEERVEVENLVLGARPLALAADSKSESRELRFDAVAIPGGVLYLTIREQGQGVHVSMSAEGGEPIPGALVFSGTTHKLEIDPETWPHEEQGEFLCLDFEAACNARFEYFPYRNDFPIR